MNSYRESLLSELKMKLNQEMTSISAKQASHQYLIYFKKSFQTIDYLIKLFHFSQPLSFEMLIHKYTEFLFDNKQINLDSINIINPAYSKLGYDFINLAYNKKLLVYNDKISTKR